MRYTLRGRWPNGATSEHTGGSLHGLRILADNWARAGAECTISLGAAVIVRTDAHPPT